MQLNEWIKKYEDSTGEKFKPHPQFRLFFLPERGFCEYHSDGNLLMIYQLCGDGKFWYDYATLLALLTSCKNIGTICIRKNVKAYIRFWGYKITSIDNLDGGLHRYHCINKYGKKSLLSPAWTDKEKTIQAYYVTWEV